MSSSLEINLIFHCLRISYITCTTPIVYYLFNHLTSPCNSKVTSRDVSQWFVNNIKKTCSQLDMETVQNLLAQNITNPYLKDSLVNVQIPSINSLISPTVKNNTLACIWLPLPKYWIFQLIFLIKSANKFSSTLPGEITYSFFYEYCTYKQIEPKITITRCL